MEHKLYYCVTISNNKKAAVTVNNSNTTREEFADNVLLDLDMRAYYSNQIPSMQSKLQHADDNTV